MMKLQKRLLFLSALVATSLVACNNAKPEPQPEPDNTVDVFVLSGQSNMEGSTYFDHNQQWLEKACDRLGLDSTPMFDGYGNILTSYYGYYPYNQMGNHAETNPNPHASNKQNPMDGEFLPTKVGMGNTDQYMGPEIGIAEALKEKATEDRPIYLIKCAFSGSGFAKPEANWILEGDTRTDYQYNEQYNLYNNKLKPFTQNNIELIKATGKEPVIKGFLWHQGESDTGKEAAYEVSMKALIKQFRDDFAEYAPNQDGENIAFIDGYIYDGPNSPYGNGAQSLNNVKQKIAEEGENNYVVNSSYKQTYGYSIDENDAPMECAINYQAGDVEGGVDYYHYKTYDALRLGMAYGGVIRDKVLGE